MAIILPSISVGAAKNLRQASVPEHQKADIVKEAAAFAAKYLSEQKHTEQKAVPAVKTRKTKGGKQPDNVAVTADDLMPYFDDIVTNFPPTRRPTKRPSQHPTMRPTHPTFMPSFDQTETPTQFPSSLQCSHTYTYQQDSSTPLPTDSICGCCSRTSSRNTTSTITKSTEVTVVQSFDGDNINPSAAPTMEPTQY